VELWPLQRSHGLYTFLTASTTHSNSLYLHSCNIYWPWGLRQGWGDLRRVNSGFFGWFIAVAAVNAATAIVIVVDSLKSLETCARIGEFMNGER
jgi:hypothetical protein